MSTLKLERDIAYFGRRAAECELEAARHPKQSEAERRRAQFYRAEQERVLREWMRPSLGNLLRKLWPFPRTSAECRRAPCGQAHAPHKPRL